MAFKLNISDKTKAWRAELESEHLIGKKIGEKVSGKEIKEDWEGYELEITGTSDKAGFPGMKEIDSPMLTKRLLTRGFGMKTASPHGLRLRKTLRGGIISEDTMQINMKVVKHGNKKLTELFPEQNKAKEEAKPASEAKEE
ncbi:MAG: S6e family ribosomal protein [Nanoarchaeota archaeon]